MPDAGSLALFAAAAVVLAVTPGPAVVYVIAQGAHAGARAGLVSALGIATGNLVHVAAAVAGLGALIVSSATAYQAVKYAGAAYLVWIGVRRLLERDRAAAADAVRRPLGRLYGNGVVVNVLNPKTALFSHRLDLHRPRRGDRRQRRPEGVSSRSTSSSHSRWASTIRRARRWFSRR